MPDEEEPKQYHPSVVSETEISAAHDIALAIRARTHIDERADDLYDVCRALQLGQLAYALLHLKNAYPARDRAIADAFLELFRPKYVH